MINLDHELKDMRGEKYYSFALLDRDFKMSHGTLYSIPAHLTVRMNSVLAEITITNSNFEITITGSLGFDSSSKELIIGVLDRLIHKNKVGVPTVNTDNGAIANAWYSMGYDLHKILHSEMIFVRLD